MRWFCVAQVRLLRDCTSLNKQKKETNKGTRRLYLVERRLILGRKKKIPLADHAMSRPGRESIVDMGPFLRTQSKIRKKNIGSIFRQQL